MRSWERLLVDNGEVADWSTPIHIDGPCARPYATSMPGVISSTTRMISKSTAFTKIPKGPLIPMRSMELHLHASKLPEAGSRLISVRIANFECVTQALHLVNGIHRGSLLFDLRTQSKGALPTRMEGPIPSRDGILT
jgi:hypothetical protein